MRYFKDYYKFYYRNNRDKSDSFIYELALKRGKDRGWYPKKWTVQDYEQYLFGKYPVTEES